MTLYIVQHFIHKEQDLHAFNTRSSSQANNDDGDDYTLRLHSACFSGIQKHPANVNEISITYFSETGKHYSFPERRRYGTVFIQVPQALGGASWQDAQPL